MSNRDPSSILIGLTEAQQRAVEHLDGPALVLAGPGSGKTRVITRRVAHLISCGVPAWSILAVTFTNKAAAEMRSRIDAIVPADVPGRRGLTVTTFHAFCARMLRQYAADAGLTEAYTIYDAADQRAAMKQALKSAELDSKNWSPASIHSAISNAKNQLIDVDDFARSAHDFFTKCVSRAYRAYQTILNAAGAVDFDDLLLRVAKLLRDNERVRGELQERYQYLLIDEYQDTNHAQFIIAHTLASKHRNIFVVGDPDQSIYGWRGADLRNILDFERHYPEAVVLPLGENFRSTKSIVAAADGLIRHNGMRKHKDLFTANDEGEKPQVVRVHDEHDESRLVVDELMRRHEQGVAWKDMAVMYRINALSRVIEEALRNASVPYVIARGTAFYERAEIKDALAYLRVVANPNDEISLRRIINTPTRGIGKTTLDRVELHAYNSGVSMIEALRQADSIADLTARAQKSIRDFVGTIDSWRSHLGIEAPLSDEMLVGAELTNLAELVEHIIRDSGLESMYRKSKTEEDIERLANLEELVSSAQQFAAPLALGPEPTLLQVLLAYLESITLVSDADMVDPENGAVTLLTLHAAKGLEFPAVCIIGLEQGVLPHFNASGSEAEVEEERRLCYVGITRAERFLMLSSAAARTHRGLRERTIPSPFLDELPEEVIERSDQTDDFGAWGDGDPGGGAPDRGAADRSRDWYGEAETKPGMAVGSLVRHPQFGVGRIENVSRMRDHTRAQIAFAVVGRKTLILEYARLEAVE